MKRLITAATLALIFSAQLTHAGADCKDNPKSSWLSEFEIQKKIVNDYGFAIKKFKIDGNCYEIYGWEKSDNKDGKQRIEVYFDTKTGEIVKKEID